ncbi:MAG: phosphate acyltransferase, partial [Anaerotignum sp.]|nr:phosphate acyltransferase [Anaerotignum sp.]
MEKRIIVALDAMGGDLAPVETVKGAVEAVKELNVDIKLVGPEDV